MKTLPLLSLSFCVLLVACEKEEYDVFEASERYCHDNMVFTCDDVPDADIYFRARLNDEDFCLTVPKDDYYALNGTVTVSVTSTDHPELGADATPIGSYFQLAIRPPIFDNVNGLKRDFAAGFTLHSPTIYDTILRPAEWYLDSFFREGTLPLRRVGEEQSEGYLFYIDWTTVFRPGYDHYYRKDPDRIPVVGLGLSPSFGAAQDAALELVEVRKRELPETLRYYLTFRLDADLFYSGTQYGGDYFGRLEEGEFRMILDL